jgi:hypothetical protein
MPTLVAVTTVGDIAVAATQCLHAELERSTRLTVHLLNDYSYQRLKETDAQVVVEVIVTDAMVSEHAPGWLEAIVTLEASVFEPTMLQLLNQLSATGTHTEQQDLTSDNVNKSCTPMSVPGSLNSSIAIALTVASEKLAKSLADLGASPLIDPG